MPTITAPPDTVSWSDPDPIVYAQPARRLPGDPLFDEPGEWTGFIQTRTGTQTASLALANMGRFQRRKNDGHSSSIEVDRHNTVVLAECKRWLREVAYYRNGRLQCCGPIKGRKRSGSKGSRTFDFGAIEDYLNKRVRLAPEAQVVNFFLNPRFDDDLANWTGRTPGGVVAPSTATLDPLDSETGTQSAVLVDGQSLSQPILFTAFHVAFTLEISARVKIAEDVEAGQFITVDIPGVSATPRFSSANIEASAPRGVWTTIRCTIEVDGTTQPQVAVFPAFHGLPGGSIKVDHCTATIIGIEALLKDTYKLDVLPEATAPELDQARIVANVVQGANSDLNLNVDAPFTGQVMTDDKGQPEICWDVIKRIVDVGAFDVAVEASRFIRTLRTFHPHRGSDIDPEVFTLTPHWVGDQPPTCVDYDDPEDSSDAVNDLFATGDEGHFGRAIDLEGWEDFPLQGVRAAPSGLTDAQRDAWASTNLIADPGEATALKMTGIDGKWLDVVDVCDRVWVSINDADCVVDERWEIVEMDVDPATDTFDVVLNKIRPDA